MTRPDDSDGHQADADSRVSDSAPPPPCGFGQAAKAALEPPYDPFARSRWPDGEWAIQGLYKRTSELQSVLN